MKLPKAKTDNIVVQNLKGELLVYNLATHQAYTLNETLKIVYNACAGENSFADLKRRFKFTDDLIHLALDKLRQNELLEDYAGDPFAGLSRREIVRRVGLACTVALPLISALAAPLAAHAVSSAPPACSMNLNNPPGYLNLAYTNSASECRALCTSNRFKQCNYNSVVQSCACGI